MLAFNGDSVSEILHSGYITILQAAPFCNSPRFSDPVTYPTTCFYCALDLSKPESQAIHSSRQLFHRFTGPLEARNPPQGDSHGLSSTMETILTPAERATLDYVRSKGGSVPLDFSIAASVPTKGSNWRPNQFDKSPFLKRTLTANDWGRGGLTKTLDVDAPWRLYVRLSDGSGEGWVLWSRVPDDHKRSAAASKSRMMKAWMEGNGLIKSGPKTSGQAVTPAAKGEVASGEKGTSPQGLTKMQTRSATRILTTNSEEPVEDWVSFEPYDGRCNEPLSEGCVHAGLSTACEGDNMGKNRHRIEPHYHSTSTSSSVLCIDDDCVVYETGIFGVCEGCAINVWSKVYTDEERGWILRALAEGLPIATKKWCDECVVNDLADGEPKRCGCGYFGKIGKNKCSADRKAEVADGVTKAVMSTYAQMQSFCGNEGCGKALDGGEKVLECLSCFGFIDLGFTNYDQTPAIDFEEAFQVADSGGYVNQAGSGAGQLDGAYNTPMAKTTAHSVTGNYAAAGGELEDELSSILGGFGVSLGESAHVETAPGAENDLGIDFDMLDF
ncbi:hypothetical protein CAC42_1050 [Sphaceloma murrayae]|uniref:Uncharacterized protein n=1 Tax=Sphaceloma murrayae TaxID=2082308 RepID=A0A2K1R1W3_9PEZI|nr:hypothetical protein CAC42_1050 [Sphaceloma murrayae]